MKDYWSEWAAIGDKPKNVLTMQKVKREGYFSTGDIFTLAEHGAIEWSIFNMVENADRTLTIKAVDSSDSRKVVTVENVARAL